ncbi:hypothetical protein C942_03576 [Photobacterium marinum]|uniref:DUF3306 domain-containing protein n=1 Tax=Photobacterium marinum TaxID=1056511 RepID=L8J3W6_9GAMM|nr:DUF3306 domain-containing protein [Photobacterium marinum]ELR63560.1 hypothetical protein C942_03576 [Photobacterium marinum]
MATNFFQRWSSRKLAAREEPKQEPLQDKEAAQHLNAEASNEAANSKEVADFSEQAAVQTPAAVNQIPADSAPDDESGHTAPTLEDVDEVSYETGVASFMKSDVEKSVKKAALRKLFQSEEFNYISDMDDCTGDYSNLTPLDSSVTKQLRNWMDEVVNDLEQEGEETESVESAEQTELDSIDIHFDPNQLIEKEAFASKTQESFPTSAEGETSEKTQEEQPVKDV